MKKPKHKLIEGRNGPAPKGARPKGTPPAPPRLLPKLIIPKDVRAIKFTGTWECKFYE